MQIVTELELRYPQIQIVADIQQKPGDPVPQLIDNFRPDVYAVLPRGKSATIIAEAKTDEDIDNRHTRSQLTAFINYIGRHGSGSFILSVTGFGADRAKTLLRFLYQEICSTSTVLYVFDGCDLWSLDSTSGVTWHLN